ncbi:hypothetical protein PN450_19060 [Dolichospermum lemmermannii CS-548]|uniref:hypothetical protein n=1 Tax=Dolichospermum lemmermannii TaxID=54295 RepID=UPI00232AB8A0|nr:hypothetical protein [Dolichospermum lemmermannii]MDB9438846.1 hypothetical protein [Dolichospermum lemmermannii CS-548]
MSVVSCQLSVVSCWLEISFSSLPSSPATYALPYFLNHRGDTALPGVMRYISSGQDARTTRVS